MTVQTFTIPESMKSMIETHPGIKAYFMKYGPVASRRFWNLLRTSLMRQHPADLKEYLEDESLKLSEVKANKQYLGKELVETFFNSQTESDLRESQKALILACMEMDAAWRMDAAMRRKSNESQREWLECLKEKLGLWRVR